MAKQEKTSFSKRIAIVFLLIFLVAGGWWISQNPRITQWKDQILQYVDNRDIVTLEARFPPKQIVDTFRKESGNEKKVLRNTITKYYPYFLLDVKYTDAQKTKEGVLLWGLTEGEIILNTDTWESTHGFRDCIECQAERHDFKILQTLAHSQGALSIEDIQKSLRMDREILASWIEGVKRKGLVVQKGPFLQLHFENPRLLVTPQTKIKHPFVSKPLGNLQKVPNTYTHKQIIETTLAAFGNDFKIRNEQEIFLPVYSLEILNPDGTIQVIEWNALTGQRIVPHYLFKEDSVIDRT